MTNDAVRCRLRAGLLFLLFLTPTQLFAQQNQNPSPMVEHTRAHPRLRQASVAGTRQELRLGRLFIPQSVHRKRVMPLLVHFHGPQWLVELAASRRKIAAVSVHIGIGSGVYAQAFSDPRTFDGLLTEAQQRANIQFEPILLSCWSAGYGAIREILKNTSARIGAVLLIDGLHTAYVTGSPGPAESQLETSGLEVFVKFARDAVAGRKQMIVAHSEIFPGTFASTTETADYLLAQLGLKKKAVLKWGPMKMQQLSEAKAGRFLSVGYAGNSAPDHVDQLHAMPELLKWIK